MNYIKLFEAYGDDGFVPPHLMTKFKNEIKSFCYDYLSFLIDDGFIIEVTEQYTNLHQPMDSVLIKLHVSENRTKTFEWDDIKDVFIPFYTILSNKYNIGIDRHNVIIRNDNNPLVRKSSLESESKLLGRQYYYSKDILNDNIKDFNILDIKIQVECMYKKEY